MAEHILHGPDSEQWTVPEGVTEVTIECWGGEGGDGNGDTDDGAGGGGGYVKGDLSVTPGETLHLVAGGDAYRGEDSGGFPNGGSGDVRGTNMEYQLVESGGGGGSSHVMQGGSDRQNDVVIGAGGGGGGAAVSSGGGATNYDDGKRGGHANGGDAPDTIEYEGGQGGESSKSDPTIGEDGNQEKKTKDGDAYLGASGGGGGGFNAGSRGIVDITFSRNDLNATGGGAGEQYTLGVTNVTTKDNENTGNGKVKITYTEPVTVKYWDGSKWVSGRLKYWDGSKWVMANEISNFDGSQWQTTS
ncbi:hypothetical protein [Candidatus Nanohalobium constans]|uniref:Uncharacterized protein n=1 Tax=Candidatus Nanohalobium constans TaxID=2565781 RepID=A0A5Q0UFH6_9ARCH|nr:hypothetical protein [Candidatus Nanohalobium constans]QGA80337.1 hypothetical protein LC1Nh_0436 [Candidatus Nanohalobium constans]